MEQNKQDILTKKETEKMCLSGDCELGKCVPQRTSPHVETVCLLSKLHEAKHHVNVRLDMDELDITSAERR